MAVQPLARVSKYNHYWSSYFILYCLEFAGISEGLGGLGKRQSIINRIITTSSCVKHAGIRDGFLVMSVVIGVSMIIYAIISNNLRPRVIIVEVSQQVLKYIYIYLFL